MSDANSRFQNHSRLVEVDRPRDLEIGRNPPRVLFSFLIIGAISFGAILPMFFLGIPSGHDFEFHLNSWLEVVRQWKHGIIYPRWAALAQHGYGEARFLFYPPASWMLGGLLGMLLPWSAVPGAYIWIALSLAGCTMFLLARRFFEWRDALFAAAMYALNPYHLVIVYWRSAFAELLASCLLPLLLLLILRMKEEGSRIIIPLALVVAAAWLTNAPSAVIINYSLALLIVLIAVLERTPKLLIYGAVAVILGAALAAFYVLPAAYEEKWVNIAEVLSPGVRPQDNFLFTTIADVDHNRFNLLVSVVGLTVMGVTGLCIILSRRFRRRAHGFWWTTAAWALAATVLMFSFSFPLWEHLPKLRFVQLPWRWLLCLNLALAIFMTMALRRWTFRIVVCVALIGVIAGVWLRLQPPWWDTAADVAEMRDNVQSGRGYEGTDEYVPSGGDAYNVKQDAPKAMLENEGAGRVRLASWEPESKMLVVDALKPDRLILRLFNYPAWKAQVNGKAVQINSQEDTGQMVIPVPAGVDRVELKFTRTWDRTAGTAISAAALIGMIVAWMAARKRQIVRA
ncbi:MAG TPA: 6-pyruvoyl-tetrahydropterin synthase-related protein [Terriglobales bacterium]|nr:6-pyruvoyl-tetrahydropterin synthase-related protein [Terriglobales bacterium]